MRKLWRIFVAGCLIVPALGTAQGYPDKPIRFVVGFAAGGSSDVLARAVGKAMSDGLGQPLVVENRPGASGHIAAEAVARALAPEGSVEQTPARGITGLPDGSTLVTWFLDHASASHL